MLEKIEVTLGSRRVGRVEVVHLAGGREHTEVDEPGTWDALAHIQGLLHCMIEGSPTGVELRVDGLDEPLLRSLPIGVLDGLEGDDAGDLLGLLAGTLGEPADGDLSFNR